MKLKRAVETELYKECIILIAKTERLFSKDRTKSKLEIFQKLRNLIKFDFNNYFCLYSFILPFKYFISYLKRDISMNDIFILN